MSIKLEQKVKEVKNRYNVSGEIFCDRLIGQYVEQHYKLKKHISTLYNSNKDAKIIVFYELDMYDDQPLFSIKVRMVQSILNELGIDNSTVIIVTTNPNIEKEINEVSKYSNNSGKIMFEIVDSEFIPMPFPGDPAPQTPEVN